MNGRRAIGVAALVMLGACRAEAKDLPAAVEPQYLLFQLFTAGPGFTTEPGRQALSQLPEPETLEQQTKSIIDAIGARGDAQHRLGVVIGPLALDYTAEQSRELIRRSFALAAKYRVAIALHIDDSKFWLNRRDLWSNPANVEWLDWNKTPNTGQYLNWGVPWKLAPQACFNSPALLAEVRRIAGSVIGPAIAAELAKLHATGDDALFAGVLVGWETAIGQDHDTRRDLGYCALSNLGYGPANPPPDADHALESVVQSWIGTWSDSLAGAGVPANRLYSHIAFTSRRQFEQGGRPDSRSYSRSVLFTPPPVAFGPGHRAGFTTYPNADILSELYAAVNAHGAMPWASSEGANVNIHSGPPAIPKERMEDYLARMFNHGGVITNVFGWGIGDRDNVFRRSTEGADAIAAYRKFLRAEPLEEKPLAQSYQGELTALQSAMRALPGWLESYQRAGGEMRRLQPDIAQIQQDLADGRFDATKRRLDQVKQTIDETLSQAPGGSAAPAFDVGSLQQGMQALPQKITTYQQRNGDMSRIRPRVESIQKHIGAGDLRLAYEELQALEPMLASQ